MWVWGVEVRWASSRVPADFLPTLCPQVAVMEAAAQFVVESPDVVYGPEAIEAQYEYRTTSVRREDGILKVGKGSRGLGNP